MKFISSIFFGIVLLQGALSDPGLFDFITDIGTGVAQGIGNAAESMSSNIPSINQDDSSDDNENPNIFSIPSIFGNAIKGAVDIASGFGQAAAQKAGEAIQISTETIKGAVNAAVNVGKLVEQGIRDAAKKLANIANQVRQVRNRVLRNAINYAKKPVEDAQDNLQSLNKISQQKLKQSLERLNKTIHDASRLENWAEEQKTKFEFASDETKAKANDEINKFVQEREKESQKCAKNAIRPLEKLFNDTRKFTESGLPAVHSVLDSIQGCLSNRFPTPTVIGRCATNIRRSASKILAIPRRAAGLKRKFIGTAADEVFNAPCIAESRVKIKRGKANLEKKLDELLQADAATTTETVSETTESSDSSTTTDSSGDENSTTESSGSGISSSASSTVEPSTAAEESTPPAAEETTTSAGSSTVESSPGPEKSTPPAAEETTTSAGSSTAITSTV